MNRKSIFLLLFPVFAFAQSQDQNYVKTTVYKKASTEETIDHDDPAHVAVQLSYFDGLGRPTQQVAYKQSATGKDIISHIEYDAFGRQDKDFLPYIRSTASKDHDPGAETNVMSFYGSSNPSLTGNPHFETTLNPYSEKLLEASPLSRVFKQSAPGDVWALGQGKEIKFDYQTNGEEEVILFRVTAAWSSSLEIYADIPLIKDGYYGAGQLYKTITKDENWTSGKNHTTEEFRDKEGRVILKRTYDNGEKHDTYYVYDNYGNLTYVIPPLVDTSGSINQNILDGLCYQYKYDRRNRLAEKKLPGKKWEYIVYDKLDRVVMTGPVRPPFYNLSNDGWLFIKYDAFDRVVMTGFIAQNANSSKRKDYQDDRNSQSSNLYESRLSPGNTTSYSYSGTTITHSYTNVSMPVSGYHVLTINYYDDYQYADAPTVPTATEELPVYYNNTVKPKGLLTGKWTRALVNTTSQPSSRKETSYILYDKKSRPIRTRMNNYEISQGYTQTDVRYDFEGKAVETRTLHKRTSDSNNQSEQITVRDFYTYSAQGRLLTHTHQVNNDPVQLLAENTYDELGQLIAKKTGNTTNDPLQKTDYRYNVRGWPTHINDIDDLEQAGDPKDLFAFKLNYNTVANDVNNMAKPLYNGNIAESFWRTGSDNVLRSYSYGYDDINRLRDAWYHKSNLLTESYNEHISYDKNGNITKLTRNGASDVTLPAIEIDYLIYDYAENSNRLLKVTDGVSSVHSDGFNDGANNTEEYGYTDGFGNMTRDDNKGITNIKYNHLNLPVEIIFAGGDKIQYIYNAEGKKLEKTVIQNSVSVTTKYLEGFQYVNNVLQFFPHAEGYVSQQGSSYRYVFNHTDHLGNIRLKYCDLNQNGVIEPNEILEENNYYPFGLKHEGYNIDVSGPADKYRYNHREFQDELNLNMTAMDFRQYDNALGRFYGMDKLSELAYSISPYRFAFNNPNYWADPTGLSEKSWKGWVDTGNFIFWDSKVNNQGDVDSFYKDKGFTYVPDDTVVVDSDGDSRRLNGDGTVTTMLDEVVVSSQPKKSSTNWFFMSESYWLWGPNRYGDLMGNKNGTAKHSIDVSQIPTGGGARSLKNKNHNWLKWLLSWISNSSSTAQQATTIQEAVTENPNATTMDVQNIEPVAPPPQAVEAVLIHIQQDTTTYEVFGLSKSDTTYRAFNNGPDPRGLINAKTMGSDLLKIPGIDSVSIKKKYK